LIRVLVIDDSPSVRTRLTHLFKVTSHFVLVGEAANGAEALTLMAKDEVDIVCLDVFLEKESAASVVHRILSQYQVRIVLVSEAPKDAPEVFDALAAGALELVAKPKRGNVREVTAFLQTIRRLSETELRALPPKFHAPKRAPTSKLRWGVVVVGSSTGAPGPLRQLLSDLPEDFPLPMVVAQHLIRGFEPGFVQWLARSSPLRVALAEEGATLAAGHVLLGPSGFDITLSAGNKVSITPAQEGFHPSADALFASADHVCGGKACAVVLSGIGNDGAKGAQRLAARGGFVVVQDPNTCPVTGMPGAVLALGVPAKVAKPSDLAAVLLENLAEFQ
jgi:two-component system chemotaxis response regulator CheB